MPDLQVVLGFDFGMKRIGVAVGQTITRTATPLTVLAAQQGVPDWSAVAALIQTWQPSALVVGHPLNMDGTTQYLTEAAEAFAAALQEHYQLPVYQVDERLTTVEARASVFDAGGYRALTKGPVDGIAAQLILQDWLNRSIE